MPPLPRGGPVIDLLVPPGGASLVVDLQTRIDLVSGGSWTVMADDGSMEQSLVPMQPIRGTLDRIQVYRNQPYAPGESLQGPASLAVELAVETQAKLAVLGVNGVYAWGVVLMEDVRWLHGLALLDWLYNPRLDERGEIVEGEPDPDTIEEALSRKLAVFQHLWIPTRSAALSQQLPPGALQQVESHLALMLLGPGGAFDPRFWQGFAMQLALAEVRAFAGTDAPPAAAAPPSAAPVEAPAAAAPPPAPAAPAEPDAGLPPLARAPRDAARRQAQAAREAAESADKAAVAPPPEPEATGPALRWLSTSAGPLVWIPGVRMDSALLRRLRDGDVDGLSRAERPDQQRLEQWMEAGAAFATEVPFLSRLFLNGTPLHKGTWAEAATEADGLQTATCHLPRVAPVRAVFVPAGGDFDRRILVCSRTDLGPTEIVALAE